MRRIFKASALLVTVLSAAVAVASSPATGASTPTTIYPVRSTLTPARIVYATPADFTHHWTDVQRTTNIVLELKVNRQGKVRHVQVVKSEDPALDGPVVDAVRKYRFSPAMLDHQPVLVDMNLIIKVRS